MKNTPSISQRGAFSALGLWCEQGFKWSKSFYYVDSGRHFLGINFTHRFLTQSCWTTGIEKETVEHSIEYSLCFAFYHQQWQIGFGRKVADFSTFAYLYNVFLLTKYQDVIFALWLITYCLKYLLMERPRCIMLVTTRVPLLYEKTGFQLLN